MKNSLHLLPRAVSAHTPKVARGVASNKQWPVYLIIYPIMVIQYKTQYMDIQNVDICCGLAWGDESKGKIVSHLVK